MIETTYIKGKVCCIHQKNNGHKCECHYILKKIIQLNQLTIKKPLTIKLRYFPKLDFIQKTIIEKKSLQPCENCGTIKQKIWQGISIRYAQPKKNNIIASYCSENCWIENCRK